jgi:hypothetical protein
VGTAQNLHNSTFRKQLFRKGSYATTRLKDTKTKTLTQHELDNMTEENNNQEQPEKHEEPENQEQPAPTKLQIDEPTNFPFHAAYLVYSEIFDNATSDSVKREINGYIENLKQNQIDLETFYRNVAHYRKMALPSRERFALQTQRKKDWRIREQRHDRSRRHKK